jgi:hypothetical protein
LIANNFTAQKHPFGNWALMLVIYGSFATGKPAFWCQKDKDQTDYTKKIPLPGVTRVIPEEYLLQCGRQASHVFKLASKQPLESWLAGRLILPKTLIPLEQENQFVFGKETWTKGEQMAKAQQYGRPASARFDGTSRRPPDCE